MSATTNRISTVASDALAESAAAESGQMTFSRICTLSNELAQSVGAATKQISGITASSRMLSFNARIEAARAEGPAGAAFSVVAAEMSQLSDRTAKVASDMSEQVTTLLTELSTVANHIATDVRGTRLSDLALNNIDLIDRNLYERSCDCRWWATDPAFVDTLQSPTDAKLKYASTRMATILNAYTVYFDLVLADRTGKIIANGRPDKFRSVGHDASRQPWFQDSMSTRSGDEFAFQTAHVSPLANNARTLIYSAAVREGGATNGRPLGALGLIFNWDGLAKRVIDNTPLPPDEKPRTRISIIDPEGNLLSDSAGLELTTRIHFAALPALLKSPKSFATLTDGGKSQVVAQAKSPGFETYSTGWHCLIQQTD